METLLAEVIVMHVMLTVILLPAHPIVERLQLVCAMVATTVLQVLESVRQ
jgi:hypothetical protein